MCKPYLWKYNNADSTESIFVQIWWHCSYNLDSMPSKYCVVVFQKEFLGITQTPINLDYSICIFKVPFNSVDECTEDHIDYYKTKNTSSI